MVKALFQTKDSFLTKYYFLVKDGGEVKIWADTPKSF